MSLFDRARQTRTANASQQQSAKTVKQQATERFTTEVLSDVSNAVYSKLCSDFEQKLIADGYIEEISFDYSCLGTNEYAVNIENADIRKQNFDNYSIKRYGSPLDKKLICDSLEASAKQAFSKFVTDDLDGSYAVQTSIPRTELRDGGWVKGFLPEAEVSEDIFNRKVDFFVRAHLRFSPKITV